MLIPELMTPINTIATTTATDATRATMSSSTGMGRSMKKEPVVTLRTGDIPGGIENTCNTRKVLCPLAGKLKES